MPCWGAGNGNSYGGVTYGKTASVLLTLEGIIGEDTMAKAMRTYFMKYRFTHPTKEAFLKTIEEVSGRDLRWYFNQAVYGSQVMDYEVMKVESFPMAVRAEPDFAPPPWRPSSARSRPGQQTGLRPHRRPEASAGRRR